MRWMFSIYTLHLIMNADQVRTHHLGHIDKILGNLFSNYTGKLNSNGHELNLMLNNSSACIEKDPKF